MTLDELEETAFDFDYALRYYHRYSDRELFDFLKNIEKIVDNIIIRHRPTKPPTDYKFRWFNDMLAEYENTMKALREDVVMVVRRLNRNLVYLSFETPHIPTAEATRELERYVGEGKVAEHLDEFDERVKELSYTARSILTCVFNAPMREVNLRDLPVRIGLTGRDAGRIVSDAVDELTRKMPDVVKVVPDTVRGGYKIVLRR